ncbi:MAG: hypothetical protein ACXVHV_10580 [Methanobacterium sp.]
MYGEGKHMGMYGEDKHMGMKKDWMMKKWLMKLMTEEEMKMMAVKKLDMKIAALEQKLEYHKWLRNLLKSKI